MNGEEIDLTAHTEQDRIDGAVLALLLLGLHDGCGPGKDSTGTRWIACTRRAYFNAGRQGKVRRLSDEGLGGGQTLYDALFVKGGTARG
jgi:hypothetical protein